MRKIPKSAYGRTNIRRIPCAKLLATRRPSADDSKAARHIAQPCPKAEDCNVRMSPIVEITTSSLFISAHPKHMRRVAQSLWERKGKQYQCQDQWSKSNQ